MRIAIDSGPLNSGHKIRGVGTYTRGLIESLKSLKPRGVEIEAVDFETADLAKYDIVHYPYFSPFQRTLPISKPTKIVVTVHDLIPLIYPTHYKPGIKGQINFSLQKLALRNIDAIVTDSETSKKDIVRLLNFEPGRIWVVRLAPKEIFKKISDRTFLKTIKEKYKLPDKFVLYVGDVNYNKNIPGLIEACELAKLPLVMCGKQAVEIEDLDLTHPELGHLKPIVGKLKKISRLGFVPDKDLVGIYNLASLYCQPSLYEGFGFPVLEAFASQTPVVAACTQALVEIGEGACLFADPNDPKEMAAKFTQILKEAALRRELVTKGEEKSTEFSWSKVAKETLEVYAKV